MGSRFPAMQEYAEAGKDIVCAGVTALVQGLIGSVESLISDKIEYEISPGRADIHYGDLSEAGNASGGFLFHWRLSDRR